MRACRAALAAICLGLALTGPAPAQDAAQLAADSLRIEADNRLVAEGNVEVFYRGARLRAGRVTYIRGSDGLPDRLEIAGPIALDDGERVLILAEAADLSADLRDGMMQGARMVLDRQLQMAANAIIREGGRFTRLEQAVASSCQVCAERPVPLWEIRARRIEHDAETRQITFEHAQFRVAGRTVAVIPRLRMPDPSVTRATGLLAPEIGGSGRLGYGIELPYFIALAPDRDLTLLPRVTSRGSFTFGARYRQAFVRGDIELDGAVTRDHLRPGVTRGFLRATGRFALAPDTRLDFRLQATSDRRYFDDYGGDAGNRSSVVVIERVRRDVFDRARLTRFRTDRDGVARATQPNPVADVEMVRRFPMPVVGGTGRLGFSALALRRSASDPTDGLGRDLQSAALRIDWRRSWLTEGGLEMTALADVQADYTHIRQDADFPPRVSRVAPAVGVELRWPLERRGADGARYLLQPVAQVVLAPRDLDAVPNETSRLVEFDEATLFALLRAPGADGREAGSRANLGLTWTRYDPTGWSMTLAAGRVLRADPSDLGRLTGLGGKRSDWLAAARLSAGPLDVAARAIIDDSGSAPKQELRLAFAGERLEFAGTYAHLASDTSEDRPDRSTEVGLDGTYQLTPNWEMLADARFDLARGEAQRAGLGARFRNECLAVDLSLSRRFVSSTSVTARTEFGLRVDLIGFGDSRAGPARPCAR